MVLPLAWESVKGINQPIQKCYGVSGHELGEGGLAVSLSEMAFAGELGASIDISSMRQASFIDVEVALFSESNSRILCEVNAKDATAFERTMQGLPCFKLGEVATHDRVAVQCDGETILDMTWASLRDTWLAPLDWE